MASISSAAMRSFVLSDLLRRVEAVHDRHRDVHQDHVGVDVQCDLDRLRPVCGVPDDLEPVVGGEDGLEGLAEQPVVVGDEHADPVRNVDGGLHDGPTEM
jgi:hypothetical protein